jgi:hypothetical protein
MLQSFAKARARPARLDALEALIAAEPGLERTLGTIVELAARSVAPLATQQAGRAEVTTIARADAATWVARMFLGAVEQPTPAHPRLDCAPLFGSPYPAERAKLRCMLAYFEALSPPVPPAAGASPPVPAAAGASPPVPAAAGVSPPVPAAAGVSPAVPAAAGVSPPVPAAAGVSPPPLARLPAGTLRVERVVMPVRDAAAWRADRSPLLPLEVFAAGAIEDAPACRQVDFANRFLGGGVLSGGNVQEEIRFAVAPEHLAMMIVSPMMRDDEAIVMSGCESFAATRGYGGTLAYAGHYRDPCPRLADGTPDLEMVAIDAVDYRRGNPNLQYLEPAVLRELGKARAGFSFRARASMVADGASDAAAREVPRSIATGNWGCGAFHGDPPHKAIVQWLAASAEGRAIRYYSFGDPRVGDLAAFARDATTRLGTVGALFERLLASAGVDGSALYRTLLA